MRRQRVAESPIAPIVRFSAATNLGIAGRSVRADGGVSERLRRALTGFGARFVGSGPADLVLVSGGDGAPILRLVDDPITPDERGAGDADSRTTAERIGFARAHMPASAAFAARFGDRVRGMRIGISMVLEPKTAVLALLLQEAGAAVQVFAFAAETDDAVAAALVARGVPVHASSSATPAEDRAFALALLDSRPEVLIDDGAHVIRLAHRDRPDVVAGLIGASEETTSGITPLRAMAADGALRVPVISANDARTKSWFDNRHGTGETCVLAIVRALDDDLDGARGAVIGFGPVGEGCAERLRALGAEITVVEIDPVRALAARFAGYAVAPITVAVAEADLVVSATGVPRTIDADVLAACAPGAAVAVAGGAPEEVALPPGTRREQVAPHVERLHIPGPVGSAHTVRLLAGGDCVNIVAGEGNPIDVMDLSFAVQLTAIRRLLEPPALPAGAHALDAADDACVAAVATGAQPPSDRAGRPQPRWDRTRFDLD